MVCAHAAMPIGSYITIMVDWGASIVVFVYLNLKVLQNNRRKEYMRFVQMVHPHLLCTRA
jgi:hypothetical protein